MPGPGAVHEERDVLRVVVLVARHDVEDRAAEKLGAAGLREAEFKGDIEMDGGVDSNTLLACVEAGANALVSGSALFKAPDMGAAIRDWRARAASVIEAA